MLRYFRVLVLCGIGEFSVWIQADTEAEALQKAKARFGDKSAFEITGSRMS